MSALLPSPEGERLRGGKKLSPIMETSIVRRAGFTTNAETAARFMGFCEKAGVPYQQYAHRSDLGAAAPSGLSWRRSWGASVDVGSPMWAMHSARESAGVQIMLI